VLHVNLESLDVDCCGSISTSVCLCLELQHMIYLSDGATLWSLLVKQPDFWKPKSCNATTWTFYASNDTLEVKPLQYEQFKCVCPISKKPLAQCKAVILKISVTLGIHSTGSPCLANLQDVTSKMVPKNYTQAQRGSKLRFHARLNMN
jgi:hypothetical protein